MEKEIWKNIQRYKGLYQISNFGRVKSLRRNRTLIMSQAIDRNLYRWVSFSVNNKIKYFSISRLVLQTFRPIKKFMECNHKDGKKSNNKLSNLEWVTRQENQIHAFQTGLQKRKLTKFDIKRINTLYRTSTITQQELGLIYNISRTMITRILNGTRYKNE